jgi:hypothetical protein
MAAWRGWYHLMANTFGTWLPGDPRGFRTRHHKQHIDGDYKSPPSHRYDIQHRAAKNGMKRSPVYLSPDARRCAVEAMLHALRDVHATEVLCLAINDVHLHLLARFPDGSGRRVAERTSAIDDPPRHYLGLAKQWSSKAMKARGLVDAGAWARRGKIVPIADREHQVHAFNYIIGHIDQGAAVWSFRDPVVRFKT